ncbi:membrane protein [Oenococcus oeni]|nr:membrane protein [Oenococcus oeni]
MHLIWALIIGAIIGAIAGALTSKGQAMGWVANIVAGLVGSWVGESLLGHWGPSLAGMALIPSIIGAVIVVVIVSWVMSAMNKKKIVFNKLGLIKRSLF